MGPTIVVGPDGGEIEFPEGMDDDAINAAMRQIYPPAPAAPRAAAPARQPAAAPARQPAAPAAPQPMNAMGAGLRGGSEASVSPLRRSPGQFLMDAVGEAAATANPQRLLRYLTRNLTDTEQVDPATGERFTMTGLGSELRRNELERRDRYALMEAADPWNAPDLNWFERALRGGAGIVGAFAGSAATDPTNYIGAPGVGSTIGATARNVGINAGVGAGMDAIGQGLDIGSGVQDQFSTQQMLASGALNAFLPTAIEGTLAGVNRMLPQPAAPAPARGGPAVPRNPAAQRPSQQAPGSRVVRVDDLVPGEAERLLAGGEYRVDPNDPTTIFRVVGTEAPPASLPDVEVTAAAPGAVERMPMQGDAPQGARVAAADGTPEVLPRADGAVEAVQPDGSIVVSRPDAPDEIIPAARAAEPVEVMLPDGAVEVRPRVLAEDVGAPGRAPDEVLLGPAVRALDDEFGIPPQPSPAVARAAEADLTLRAPAADVPDPDLVGNIRLSNLNSEQDIARVLETARAAGGDFVEARRGVQSFADTEELAARSGTTVKDLLARRNGQAFNAEELTVARNLMVSSAENVDAISARIAQKGDPGEDLLNEFREAVLRHVAIQEQVSGAVAEAGRALGILRNKASSINITADMLDAMMAGKGPAGLQRAARNIIEARKKGPREQAKAIEKAYKATGFDVFLEYWYNAILSGPYTHLYNVLSTGANVLNNLPVTATAAAIGAGRKLTGAQWGVERDRVLGSEFYARGVGMLTGAVDGARAFATTMRTGSVSDNVDRLDTQVRRAITSSRPGVVGASIRALGTAVRTPSRLLSAEDEFFKATARRMQLNGISLRMAHAEGLRGDAMTARAAELAKNPTEYLSAEADNFARYLTFQTEMGPGGRGILRTLDAWPASRIVVPFVRTPINLMKTTVEHSPFAPLLTEWRDDVKAGGARADVALAKMAVGMGYGMAIATAAGYGLVTGAAPADKTERKALEAAGWKPFSIRVGNQYIDYRRMDPFASILGIASTLGQPQTPHGKPVGLASAFVSGFLGQLTDKTFLTGLSDFVVAASDESGSKLEAWVKRFAGSFVPALASQTAQMIDPTKRITRTMADTQPPQPEQPLDTARRVAEVLGDTMQSRIPGMSQNLPAQRDILGDPLRAASPVTPVENDRAAQAIVSTGANVGEPGKTLQGRKLTGQEYDAYERLAGQYLREGIENWIDTPDWLEMDDEGRRELIEDLADEAREDARQELGLDQPAE